MSVGPAPRHRPVYGWRPRCGRDGLLARHGYGIALLRKLDCWTKGAAPRRPRGHPGHGASYGLADSREIRSARRLRCVLTCRSLPSVIKLTMPSSPVWKTRAPASLYRATTAG
jgi:hypothetical protein